MPPALGPERGPEEQRSRSCASSLDQLPQTWYKVNGMVWVPPTHTEDMALPTEPEEGSAVLSATESLERRVKQVLPQLEERTFKRRKLVVAPAAAGVDDDDMMVVTPPLAPPPGATLSSLSQEILPALQPVLANAAENGHHHSAPAIVTCPNCAIRHDNPASDHCRACQGPTQHMPAPPPQNGAGRGRGGRWRGRGKGRGEGGTGPGGGGATATQSAVAGSKKGTAAKTRGKPGYPRGGRVGGRWANHHAGRTAVAGQSTTPAQLKLQTPEESPHMSPAAALSDDDLRQHLVSLKVEAVQRTVRSILGKLMVHPANKGVFNTRVDVEGLKLHDYYTIVKRPMDLGTIKSRLQSLHYEDAQAFAEDVRLVFANATLYNPRGHWVHDAAVSMLEEFEKEFEKVVTKAEKSVQRACEHKCELCDGRICELCGEKCIKLEPPVLMCQGPCLQRIRRGGIYFISQDGSRVFCQKCHSCLPSALPSHCDDEDLSEAEEEQTMPGIVAGPSDEAALDESTKVGYGGGMPLLKRELLKRQFDDEVVEPWIRCCGCDKWVHQICALYNPQTPVPILEVTPGEGPRVSPQPKSPHTHTQPTAFYCPRCKLNRRANRQAMALMGPSSLSSVSVTSDQRLLPLTTTLAIGLGCAAPLPVELPHDVPFISSMGSHVPVSAAAKDWYEPMKLHMASPLPPPPPLSQPAITPPSPMHSMAMNLWSAETLPETHMSRFIQGMVRRLLMSMGEEPAARATTVRVVSSVDRSVDVHRAVRACFSLPGDGELPRTMPYRSKGILMFQKVDGADLCLFSMYVQEYDKKCPAPNRRRVYIAYLDSVEYFRPRAARTKVYHEILVAYLLWAKLRGFRHAHIWACPPQRGNNFIFWCHPCHQKTPTKERLLEWYQAMLVRAQQAGVVHRLSNLYDEHFRTIATTMQAQQQAQLLSNTPEALQRSMSSLASAASSWPQRLPCPPVFDGDFWVDEALRLAHWLRRRASGSQEKSMGARTPLQLCQAVIKSLIKHPLSGPFRVAVDPEVHHAPNYHEIITRPMDLTKALVKLKSGAYATLKDVHDDVELVFENAMTYNPPLHPIHKTAITLRTVFQKDVAAIVARCMGQHPPGRFPQLASYLSTGSLSGSVSRENSGAWPAGDQAGEVEPPDGMAFMDALTQAHSTLDDTVLSRIRLTDPIDSIAASWSRPSGSSGCSAGAGEEDPLACLEHESTVGEGSTLSGWTSTDKSLMGVSPKALVNGLTTAVDRLKGDLLVLQLQPDHVLAMDAPELDAQFLLDRGAMYLPMAPPQRAEVIVHATACDVRPAGSTEKTAVSAGAVASVVRDTSGGTCVSAVGVACVATTGQGAVAAAVGLRNEVVVGGVGPQTAFAAAQAVGGVERPGSFGDTMEVEVAAAIHHVRAETSEERAARETFMQFAEAAKQTVTFGDTTDPDGLTSSSFVDSRHTFLEMCQYRHLQFDTLRRAKHSSAMVLYHLHNPTASTLRVLCTNCLQHISAGDLRWHCGTCPELDLCVDCFEKEVHKEHKMTPYRVSFTPHSQLSRP